MSRRVPLLDLREQTDALWPELAKAVEAVLRSGRFILGPEVEAFEREMADYLGAAHAVGLNSGTDALVIALRALEIGPGDEVIAPSFSFFATAEAISQVGATPVFCDIRPDSFCIDPEEARSLVSPRTRAVLPVHLFGHAAEMDSLSQLAEDHELALVEDACQAIGGLHRERRLGTIGSVGALSFFPSKNLGAMGDAGMLVTDDAELAERARLLRSHGSRERYRNELLGYNSRMDELQAAMLRVKLRHLDAWNDARREVASIYTQGLADVAGVEPPSEADGVRHVYHQYTLRITGGRRDAMRAALDEAGVSTQIYYPIPIHRMPMYSGLPLDVTDAAADEVLSLPIWPELTRELQGRILDAVRAAAAGGLGAS